MNDSKCSVCGWAIEPPLGPIHAPYAICVEYPPEPKDRIAHFSILRGVMAKFGESLDTYRIVWLWYHEPNKNNDCWEKSLAACIKELSGRKSVLLMGAGAVSELTDYKVSNVAGLKVTSKYLPQVPLVMAAPNISILIYAPPGDTLLSIRKFVDATKVVEKKGKKRGTK